MGVFMSSIETLQRGLPGALFNPHSQFETGFMPALEDYSSILDTFHKTVGSDGRVRVSTDVTLEDYAGITSPADMERLLRLADSLKGKRISWVNATAEGGGVAIMRTPQMALLEKLGIDARWYVTPPDKKAFEVTKKWHNIFQGVAGHDVRITERDLDLYQDWTGRIAGVLVDPLASSDVVVIDDPQPSGLIPYILNANPAVKLIFRDHIQSQGQLMSQEGTPQHALWQYLWQRNQINRADCFVFHPVEGFVPGNVPAEKTVFMPPATDLLDDLNRSLTSSEMAVGIRYFNEKLLAAGQSPLDPDRKWITQIARFDPAKGIDLVLESYSLLRRNLKAAGVADMDTPQLIITGNGSIDDPDGAPMLAETLKLREEKYPHLKDDIKVARVPHYPVALNAVLRNSWVAEQLSTAEGFEYKVTEAIVMGIPVIGSRVGGIPLQIVDGVSGYTVNSGDTRAVASHLERMLLDGFTYEDMKKQIPAIARKKNYEYTTVPNIINWLHLCDNLLKNEQFYGNRRHVREMAIKT